MVLDGYAVCQWGWRQRNNMEIDVVHMNSITLPLCFLYTVNKWRNVWIRCAQIRKYFTVVRHVKCVSFSAYIPMMLRHHLGAYLPVCLKMKTNTWEYLFYTHIIILYPLVRLKVPLNKTIVTFLCRKTLQRCTLNFTALLSFRAIICSVAECSN